MKQKSKRKIIKALKDLDLYKMITPEFTYKVGSRYSFSQTVPIYIRLNDVVDWEELVK